MAPGLKPTEPLVVCALAVTLSPTRRVTRPRQGKENASHPSRGFPRGARLLLLRPAAAAPPALLTLSSGSGCMRRTKPPRCERVLSPRLCLPPALRSARTQSYGTAVAARRAPGLREARAKPGACLALVTKGPLARLSGPGHLPPERPGSAAGADARRRLRPPRAHAARAQAPLLTSSFGADPRAGRGRHHVALRRPESLR